MPQLTEDELKALASEALYTKCLQCPAEMSQTIISLISDLREAREQLAANERLVNEIQDAINAGTSPLKDWTRCATEYIPSQIRTAISMYAECIRVMGLIAKERDELQRQVRVQQRALEKIAYAKYSENGAAYLAEAFEQAQRELEESDAKL